MSAIVINGFRLTEEEYKNFQDSPYSSWLYADSNNNYYLGYTIVKTEKNSFSQLTPKLFIDENGCDSVLVAIAQKENLSDPYLNLYIGEIPNE